MLCSVPGGKSSSNWLDRLRSTKGFPTAGDVSLDHFLSNPTAEHPSDSPTPDVSTSTSRINSNSGDNHDPEVSVQNREGDWFGVMSNVLSDLFNMSGPTTGISRTKSSRKQMNPKFCPLPPESTAPQEEEKAVVAIASSFNSNIIVRPQRGDDFSDDGYDVEEDEYKDERCRADGGDRELKGYSRSEVTVIDTSYEVWKFDKLVFRKKNDWKVRDKKGRSWLSASRKRKKGSGGLERENDCRGNAGGAKKKKANVFNSHGASSIVIADGGNCASQFHDAQNLQHEKMEDLSKEVADDLISQVSKHRQADTWDEPCTSEVSERLMFKKKNVWKLKDKKGRSWMSPTKKRKTGIGGLGSGSDRHGIAGGGKKKAKVFNSHAGSSSVFPIGGNCVLQFHDAQNAQNDEMEEVPEQVADEFISQVPKHRSHGSQLHRMSKKGSGSSSVVPTKAMSNGKKSGENFH